MIVVIIILGVVLGIALLSVVVLMVRGRNRSRASALLQGEVQDLRQRLKAPEYLALTEQVEELSQLRNNLQGQVDLITREFEVKKVELRGQVDLITREVEAKKAELQGQVDLVTKELEVKKAELQGAEGQIISANTHFKELEGRLVSIEAIVQKRCHTVDEEVVRYKEGEMAKVAAEAAEARRTGLEELTKAIDELRLELQQKATEKEKLDSDYAAALSRFADLEQAHQSLAVAHADALRRVALESSGGGRIRLTDIDRQDAELLIRTSRGMKCENAIKKATYEVYVKPEIERIVRELGVAGVSGIYRIWRTVDGKDVSYIGQAVDIGERWKTHAKRAWGVDNTGRIVLYQKMMEDGIEKWNWELVEAYQPRTSEASPAVSGSGGVATFLAEREKYWGEFYAVKELGLNKKLG